MFLLLLEVTDFATASQLLFSEAQDYLSQAPPHSLLAMVRNGMFYCIFMPFSYLPAQCWAHMSQWTNPKDQQLWQGSAWALSRVPLRSQPTIYKMPPEEPLQTSFSKCRPQATSSGMMGWKGGCSKGWFLAPFADLQSLHFSEKVLQICVFASTPSSSWPAQ